mmetsp:Transcript_37748/g.92790  ORF Transcript_37748/g.92790 Transcript_37748/m.92790 type:complete len:344 (-) Transcript_37748:222-1253(-)
MFIISHTKVVGCVLFFAAAADAFMANGVLPALRRAAPARSAAVGPRMQISKERKEELMASKDLKSLFEGNEQWRQKMLSKDDEFFFKSAQGQTPKYLWIGCSDARVAANELVGCGPGELFVHRNIANLVVNNDNSLQSVFQYAVEYLQVDHIIVCAHYDCSGVTAAMQRVDLASPLEEWVRNIRDVYRLHKDELDNIKDFEKRKNRLVELNAQEQALNVYKAAVVQRRRVYTNMKEGIAQPKVHAMVFDPKTGVLKRLNTFNAAEELSNLKSLYDLYDVEAAMEMWKDEEEYPKRHSAPMKLLSVLPAAKAAAEKKKLPTGAPTAEEEAELAAEAEAARQAAE